ncbi:MAG: panthothenate synthetase [Verrucomicrobiota bacterium]
MRMMLDVTMPHEPFNTLVRQGVVGQKIAAVLEAIKPEAVYFGEHEGQRGCFMVVDLADVSKLPSIAEPLFLAFNATIKFYPVMTPADLQKAGLDAIGKKWA